MYNNHQENKLTNQSTWKRQEDKLFEYGLTVVPEDAVNRWEQIASHVPGKTAEEIRVHYEALVNDVDEIESGRADHEIPNYADDYDDEKDTELVWNRKTEFRTSQNSIGGSNSKEKPRKKGTPWTKDEHRKFVEGLAKFGKGDWRSISRISVVTRTPTQVASHAQKYFNRLDASPKERKRSSIHDIAITTTNTTMVDRRQPPTPPASLYVVQGAQLPASPPTQPSNLYVGQGVGIGAPPLPPQGQTSHFYSDQGVGKGAPPIPQQAPTSHFYSDQGVGKGAPPQPPQAPASNFYVGQGVGMAPPSQQQQQMGYGYQQNFAYPY